MPKMVHAGGCMSVDEEKREHIASVFHDASFRVVNEVFKRHGIKRMNLDADSVETIEREHAAFLLAPLFMKLTDARMRRFLGVDTGFSFKDRGQFRAYEFSIDKSRFDPNIAAFFLYALAMETDNLVEHLNGSEYQERFSLLYFIADEAIREIEPSGFDLNVSESATVTLG